MALSQASWHTTFDTSTREAEKVGLFSASQGYAENSCLKASFVHYCYWTHMVVAPSLPFIRKVAAGNESELNLGAAQDFAYVRNWTQIEQFQFTELIN